MYELNDTHNPDVLSWLGSANAADAEFPIQNLPFGVFARTGGDEDERRVGIAIGDRILDVTTAHAAGLFDGRAAAAAEACAFGRVNELLALGHRHWSALRARVSELLRANHPDQRHHRTRVEPCLVSMGEAVLHAPAVIGDYTDFYASIHHARRVGAMLRPDAPLLPNYQHLPIGYHGRSSSIVVSGTPIRRPHGQTRRGEAPPEFGPSERLDYEMEVGFFIGPGNALGARVPIDIAEEHVFGMCLVNDWSARDIQQWEYQPLGPFLGKSFATSISPWIVTLEALEPFRSPAPARSDGDPACLAYLDGERNRHAGGLDLSVDAWLASARMREQGIAAIRLCRSSLLDLYWTPAQLVAHHTSNGCNLRPGDLLASGTVSGPSDDSRACLLEQTSRGSTPILLPTGEERRFLEDGDAITLRGYAARPGMVRIGLGSCTGTIGEA